MNEQEQAITELQIQIVGLECRINQNPAGQELRSELKALRFQKNNLYLDWLVGEYDTSRQSYVGLKFQSAEPNPELKQVKGEDESSLSNLVDRLSVLSQNISNTQLSIKKAGENISNPELTTRELSEGLLTTQGIPSFHATARQNVLPLARQIVQPKEEQAVDFSGFSTKRTFDSPILSPNLQKAIIEYSQTIETQQFSFLGEVCRLVRDSYKSTMIPLELVRQQFPPSDILLANSIQGLREFPGFIKGKFVEGLEEASSVFSNSSPQGKVIQAGGPVSDKPNSGITTLSESNSLFVNSTQPVGDTWNNYTATATRLNPAVTGASYVKYADSIRKTAIATAKANQQQ